MSDSYLKWVCGSVGGVLALFNVEPIIMRGVDICRRNNIVNETIRAPKGTVLTAKTG